MRVWPGSNFYATQSDSAVWAKPQSAWWMKAAAQPPAQWPKSQNTWTAPRDEHSATARHCPVAAFAGLRLGGKAARLAVQTGLAETKASESAGNHRRQHYSRRHRQDSDGDLASRKV